MIKSELLAEKYRVQNKLSRKYPTAKAYSENARRVTQEIAEKYNFSLKYVKLPNSKVNLAVLQNRA